jgi:hypothetical protein
MRLGSGGDWAWTGFEKRNPAKIDSRKGAYLCKLASLVRQSNLSKKRVYDGKNKRLLAHHRRAVGAAGGFKSAGADAAYVTNDAVSQTTFNLPFIAAKILIRSITRKSKFNYFSSEKQPFSTFIACASWASARS